MSQSNKSIKEKTAELDEIISWFDGDDFDLNLSLEKFKQAESLTLDIEQDLMDLKNQVVEIKKRFDKEN